MSWARRTSCRQAGVSTRSPVSVLRRLSRSQRLPGEHRRPSLRSESGRREWVLATRAGTLVRAAGVQAVSPAQRGRSGATRLDGGEHTGTLWV